MKTHLDCVLTHPDEAHIANQDQPVLLQLCNKLRAKTNKGRESERLNSHQSSLECGDALTLVSTINCVFLCFKVER